MKRILHSINTGVPCTHYFDGIKPTRQKDNFVNFKKALTRFMPAFLLMCMFGSTTVSFAQGPGAGWRFSRPITLSTPTTLANYQVKVTLTTALLGNPYTNINSNGSDLRFYDNSNNLCSYWIESFSNTGTSTIWVKVVSSLASSITMYYGNASATAVSNGANTFDFFDDF